MMPTDADKLLDEAVERICYSEPLKRWDSAHAELLAAYQRGLAAAAAMVERVIPEAVERMIADPPRSETLPAAERLRSAIIAFRANAGRHSGEHRYGGMCVLCTRSYAEAEEILYDTVGDWKEWKKISDMAGEKEPK